MRERETEGGTQGVSVMAESEGRDAGQAIWIKEGVQVALCCMAASSTSTSRPSPSKRRDVVHITMLKCCAAADGSAVPAGPGGPEILLKASPESAGGVRAIGRRM